MSYKSELIIREMVKEVLSESNNKSKLFYIHGLNSSPKKDIPESLLEKFDIIAPKIDYKNDKDIFEDIYHQIEMYAPDAIIGHSLGGYLAFYLSNNFKIPALLFMPAFGDKDIEKFCPVPKEIKNLSQFENQMVVLGNKDDVIDNNKALNVFKQNKEKIVVLKNVGHDVQKSAFEKYVELFLEKKFG